MKTLMKTSITVALIVFCSMSSMTVIAQKDNSALSKLQNKIWTLQGTTDKTIEENYTKGNVIHKYNGKQFGIEEFYLSDLKDTVFDSGKKNKVENGRYIISRMVRDKSDKGSTPITVLEIIELTDEKMVLKNEKNVLIEFRSK